MILPTLQDIETAAQLVYKTLSPTPQIVWPLLCERIGTEVWLKHENHTIVGAFKVRGGLTYIDELWRTQPDVKGVISATRGNHGQSIALAARQYGLNAVIVVPRGNSKEKNAAMRALGAELVEYGDDFNQAADYAQTLAKERNLHMIASFHPTLITGVASYWLEFFNNVKDLDSVYVPIGLGSGLCAGIATRNALGLKTKLVGVVSSAAPAYALSYAAKKPVEHPATTQIADGVAVRQPHAKALTTILAGAERIVQVSDAEVTAAMRYLFSDTHNVAEGAGAISLAAVLQEHEQLQGKKVGLVLSGGNVDSDVFADVLANEF